MKYKVFLNFFAITLSGCMSTGVSTSSGNEAEYLSVNTMLEAKVGICGNLIPDEVATRFAGIDKSSPIEDRRERKQNALDHWANKVNELGSYYSQREFYITLPVNFEAEQDRLQLTQATFTSKTSTLNEEIASAIPTNILINKVAPYQKNMVYPYAAIAPKISDNEQGWVDRERRGIKVMAQYYGGSVDADKQTYVHNTLLSRGFSGPIHAYRKGSFGGADLGIPTSQQMLAFGVHVEVFNWFDLPQSIIKKDEDGFYIDTQQLANSETYFKDDRRDVNLDITYVFRLDSCSKNKLTAKTTEIIVTPRADSTIFKGENEAFVYVAQ